MNGVDEGKKGGGRKHNIGGGEMRKSWATRKRGAKRSGKVWLGGHKKKKWEEGRQKREKLKKGGEKEKSLHQHRRGEKGGG